MCDYSLEAYRSRPAEEDEKLTLERFPSGSMGFTAGSVCDTAVCVPTGAICCCRASAIPSASSAASALSRRSS